MKIPSLFINFVNNINIAKRVSTLISNKVGISNYKSNKRFIGINIDFLSGKYSEGDLIHRIDLFENWKVLDWFKLKGEENYIRLARSKLVNNEIKKTDVKLLQALEAIPVLGSYVEFGKKFFDKFK